MNITEFRRRVKVAYPHITVSVRTVDFTGLARSSRKYVTVKGDRTQAELATINGWARQAGLLPDTAIRFYDVQDDDGEIG